MSDPTELQKIREISYKLEQLALGVIALGKALRRLSQVAEQFAGDWVEGGEEE